jgi:aromatic ring-opening dioxygenase catalytic subunit (LigB family)
MTALPTYFISHGGGPWPWMDWRQMFGNLEDSLKDMPRQIGMTPKAVLVVSGHWEAREFAVMSHPRPPMVYDYSGFPPHTYDVVYPAPGAPALAQRVCELIQNAGLPAQLDETQGYDHGAFVPLYIMYPQADVPVIQLSLKHGLDPAEHLAVGRALAPLREEGVLIVGSGLSYHNLRLMGPTAQEPSNRFDAWLQQALLHSEPKERSRKLTDWEQAPAARIAHPREDHLLPLMVAVGAAENEPAAMVYHDEGLFGGMTASSFRFGEAAHP